MLTFHEGNASATLDGVPKGSCDASVTCRVAVLPRRHDSVAVGEAAAVLDPTADVPPIDATALTLAVDEGRTR